MEKQMFSNLSQIERITMMKDNADKIEKKRYMKAFDPTELSQFKEQLAETSIQISDVNEEKKVFLKEVKETLKPLELTKKEILTNIKQRSQLVEEECYMFIDHNKGEVGYYNAQGELVESRGIRPEERQKTVFNPNNSFEHEKTGTNN